MTFDYSRYGTEIEALLALDGTGERLMPLDRAPQRLPGGGDEDQS